MVFGAENAVEILIVNVLIRSEKTVFAHRALVRQNRNQSVVYDQLADPRSLVACVSHNISHCKALFQSFVQPVERNAVVNITRIDCHIENMSILVAGSLCGVSEAFLMLAFVENSSFRIGFGLGYYFLFGWVSAVKRLLAVVFTVLIYLVQELFAVDSGSLRLLSFCSRFNILSPFFIIPYLRKKAQLSLDFFDKLMRRGIHHGAFLPEILKKARQELHLPVLIKRDDIHPYALKLLDHLIVVIMPELRVKLEHLFLCLSHAGLFSC